jgi:serine/threonine protein kinase
MVKIADFGLAKATTRMDTMTQTGMSMGTPYYMSPEQGANAKDVDLRADEYSLGATFYHLLTGRMPFEGSSPIEVAIKVSTAPFPPVRSVNPGVPVSVAAVVEKMLSRERDQRYRSAEELLEALSSLERRCVWK